jgi:hypothetical protein
VTRFRKLYQNLNHWNKEHRYNNSRAGVCAKDIILELMSFGFKTANLETAAEQLLISQLMVSEKKGIVPKSSIYFK